MTTRARLAARAMWILLASVAIAVLTTARVLEPDPVRGSSAELGLPPCGFEVFTGYPCPGCGLTTCFAYMARVDLVGAWSANPFGIVLFAVTLGLVPLALVCAWRGLAVIDVLERLHAERLAIGLALLSLATWLVRVAVRASAG